MRAHPVRENLADDHLADGAASLSRNDIFFIHRSHVIILSQFECRADYL
jgi:hypothetical protein